MKRVISFILAIIMITACFAGCENNKQTAEEPFSLPLDAVKVGENSYIINMRNDDGTFTAERPGVKVTLDRNGKLISE